MQKSITSSMLSPQQTPARIVYSPSQNINPSTQQPDKFYKDRLNRYIKVTSDRELKKYVPFRRVDDGGDNMAAAKRESHGLSDQKQKYRELIEVTSCRMQQLQIQKAQVSAKKEKIYGLMGKLQLTLLSNHNLRKISLGSKEHKRNIYQWKKDHQMDLNELHLEAHSHSRKIDEDQFTLARQYKMCLFQKEQVHSQLAQIKEKTSALKQEELSLDGQIEEVSLRVQQEDETINELTRTIDKAMKEVKLSSIQISVLKMQLSPLLRVSFSNVSLDPLGDRTKILDKNYIVWPKNKIKNMETSEIRDFLVMQLYPSWRKMLNKLSYEFVGYHQILCYGELQSEETMPDLSLYLPQKIQNNRHTTSKTKSYVVVYSPLEQNRTNILNTFLSLQGLGNPIMHIQEVIIDQLQNGNHDIQVLYSFMSCERMKRFQVVQVKDLTRESMLRWLPGKEDRNVLMKLQVPLIFGSVGERSQYEEVYDLLKRWK